MRDVRWPLKAAISIGLLGYLVSQVPFVDVMSAIAGAQVPEVASAIVLGMMARHAEASRMRLLTHRRGIPLSTWDILRINLTTNFYDMLLPGDFAGGVIRWYKLALAGNNAGRALETLIMNRLAQTIVLVGSGLVFWMLDGRARAHGAVGAAIAALLGVLMLLQWSISQPAAIAKWTRLSLRASFIPEYIEALLVRVAQSTENGGVSHPPAVRLWGLTLVAEALALLSFYLLAVSLRIDLSLVSMGWVRCVVAIATMLPLSISGVGIRDATLVYLLNPYGVGAASAMALSFLLLGRRILTGLLGGVIVFRESLPLLSRAPVVGDSGRDAGVTKDQARRMRW
jgi:uncharacterized protein (TIRG00374 family)